MGTFVIVKRGWFSAQEAADDTPESIAAAIQRIRAIHPGAFRDAVGLSAEFVTLNAAHVTGGREPSKVVGTPRPIDLTAMFAGAAS